MDIRKFVILSFLLISMSNLVHAQDVIVTMDGDTIKSTIIEENSDIIKYKRSDNPEGPTYLIKKTDIAKIDHQKGTKDNFNRGIIRKESDNEKRGYIAIMFGPVFPTGDFTSKESAGKTKTGIGFGIINFGYRVGQNFGFVCSGSISRNNISPMNVEDENGEKVTIDDAKWSYGYIGVGIMITAPNPVVDIDFRFLAGLLNADYKIPSLSVDVKGDSFGYQMGLVARIHVNDKFSIPVSVDYFTGNPKFFINNNEYRKRISTVITQTGIALRIK